MFLPSDAPLASRAAYSWSVQILRCVRRALTPPVGPTASFVKKTGRIVRRIQRAVVQRTAGSANHQHTTGPASTRERPQTELLRQRTEFVANSSPARAQHDEASEISSCSNLGDHWHNRLRLGEAHSKAASKIEKVWKACSSLRRKYMKICSLSPSTSSPCMEKIGMACVSARSMRGFKCESAPIGSETARVSMKRIRGKPKMHAHL